MREDKLLFSFVGQPFFHVALFLYLFLFLLSHKSYIRAGLRVSAVVEEEEDDKVALLARAKAAGCGSLSLLNLESILLG